MNASRRQLALVSSPWAKSVTTQLPNTQEKSTPCVPLCQHKDLGGVVLCCVVLCCVVLCCVVLCCVVLRCVVLCRRRCYQKAKAGMSTHGYR